MKKIVLFQFSESGWRIAAAELELLEKHLKAGDSVLAVTCKGCRFGCDLNLRRQKLLCFNCRNQTRRGFEAMSTDIDRRDYVEYLSADDDAAIVDAGKQHGLSQKELREFHYDNFDLGEAVVSTLISRYRDPYVEPSVAPDIAKNLLEAGLAAYLAALRVIDANGADLVYLFNGRGSQQRGLLRACEKRGVDFVVVEEGCDLKHYALYHNSTPHDISYRARMIRSHWEEGNRDELSKLAQSFFEKRASGFQGYGVMKSFVRSQEKGLLPTGWDQKCHNVAVYCSSEDEFAAIGDQWKNSLYGSQLKGLQQISESMDSEEDSGVMVYLRMHPNLSELQNDFRKRCEALAHKRFVVIEPESQISSYELLFSADTVMTFASTIGVEANYWGKPSVLLGSCFYQDLGVCYRPQSHEEVMEMIMNKLAPLDKLGSYQYGSYLMSFGEKYQMSKIGSSPKDFIFRGTHLRGGLLTRSLLSLRERVVGPTIERLVNKQGH